MTQDEAKERVKKESTVEHQNDLGGILQGKIILLVTKLKRLICHSRKT